MELMTEATLSEAAQNRLILDIEEGLDNIRDTLAALGATLSVTFNRTADTENGAVDLEWIAAKEYGNTGTAPATVAKANIRIFMALANPAEEARAEQVLTEKILHFMGETLLPDDEIDLVCPSEYVSTGQRRHQSLAL